MASLNVNKALQQLVNEGATKGRSMKEGPAKGHIARMGYTRHPELPVHYMMVDSERGTQLYALIKLPGGTYWAREVIINADGKIVGDIGPSIHLA